MTAEKKINKNKNPKNDVENKENINSQKMSEKKNTLKKEKDKQDIQNLESKKKQIKKLSPDMLSNIPIMTYSNEKKENVDTSLNIKDLNKNIKKDKIQKEYSVQEEFNTHKENLNMNLNYKDIDMKNQYLKTEIYPSNFRAKKIKNKNSSMYSILSSNNNSRSNIISKRSKSSLNSTKRSKLELKVHCSPEKYPDDYLSVDSSSDEEDKFALSNNFGKQNNNNIQNKFNYFSKIILEKEKFLETDSTKEKIEKELEGFDLMSFDLKSIFRNDDFKSKYLKNITGEIKIIYFDEYQKPLQAVFAFCDREGNFIGKEKKLFSGAYDKEEFVEFCKKKKKKKKKKRKMRIKKKKKKKRKLKKT